VVARAPFGFSDVPEWADWTVLCWRLGFSVVILWSVLCVDLFYVGPVVIDRQLFNCCCPTPGHHVSLLRDTCTGAFLYAKTSPTIQAVLLFCFGF